jgi:hypothetical protein
VTGLTTIAGRAFVRRVATSSFGGELLAPPGGYLTLAEAVRQPEGDAHGDVLISGDARGDLSPRLALAAKILA